MSVPAKAGRYRVSNSVGVPAPGRQPPRVGARRGGLCRIPEGIPELRGERECVRGWSDPDEIRDDRRCAIVVAARLIERRQRGSRIQIVRELAKLLE